MLTVLVSTDEPLVELGVRTLLRLDPEFNLVAVSKGHTEALQAARQYQPDVVVCGLSRETELGGIRELQAVAPASAIVLWAREVSTEWAHQAVELGVRGFLSTTASPEHFRE